MFKKLSTLILSALLVLCGSVAMASNFKDVPSNYWAATQIKTLTEQQVITGYSDNTFKPEKKVTRQEFSSMLVKALNQQSLKVAASLPYVDMSQDMWSYGDINKINSLELVVGYPDKTFRPCANITKTEAMVVLANTLSGSNLSVQEAEKVLAKFIDAKTVRDWAKGTVSKSVKNDIYVKYPDPKVLSVNNQATRAEVADLLYKVRKSPALLAKYRAISIVTPEIGVIQHLNVANEGTSNEVLVKKLSATIKAGNVIETAFAEALNTKGITDETSVKLVLKKDLYTQEGTFLLPAGSIFEGTVSEYVKAKLFNKNAKIAFDITRVVLPSGRSYDMSAEISSKSGFIGSGYNMQNFKRDTIVAVATTAVGTGIGALAGIPHHSGKGAGIGAYSSAGAGVLAAVIVPGFDINFKEGDKVYIQLLKDLEISR